MGRIVDYPRRARRGPGRFIPSWRLVLGVATAAFLLAVIAFSVLYATVAIPDPNKLVTAQASVVYWSDGKTELGRFSAVNRQSIPLSQVPVTTQHAVLAAEDRSFYSNVGFSPTGIARAIWVKLTGGPLQGGSTITQQYVKNYFLTQERSYSRKLKEFVISVKIEQQQSKQLILQNYLNTIYFGRGAYGIQTASQAYFGRPADRLTVAQGALLAAVIRGPALYDPVTQKARAEQRFAYVLDGMVSQGWLSASERATITFPKVIARKTGNINGGPNGYLMRAVQDELKTRVGLTDAQIDQGGLRVVSTFDRRAQSAAISAMAQEMPTQGAKGVRAGLAAIRPGDGAVVAMYGGPDLVKDPLNAATQAIMQAGSTFKPFALTASLQAGNSLRSTYSGRNDQTFPGVSGTVTNFNHESFGMINLVKATEDSVNTVYVALNIDTGPDKTVAAAIAAGLPQDTLGLQPNISNVLGTSSPRVIDLADAYATFAAQGVRATPYMVRSVTSATGDVNYKATGKPVRVFSPGVMADVTYALQAVTRAGTGSYAGANLNRPVAGKTGTSTSNMSALFAGYTPQLAAVVGMYRQVHGVPASLSGLGGITEVTGGSFPVRIWTAFMRGALQGAPVKDFPPPVYGGTSNAPLYTPPPVIPTQTPTTSTPTTATPTTPTPTPTPTLTPTLPSVTGTAPASAAPTAKG